MTWIFVLKGKLNHALIEKKARIFRVRPPTPHTQNKGWVRDFQFSSVLFSLSRSFFFPNTILFRTHFSLWLHGLNHTNNSWSPEESGMSSQSIEYNTAVSFVSTQRWMPFSKERNCNETQNINLHTGRYFPCPGNIWHSSSMNNRVSSYLCRTSGSEIVTQSDTHVSFYFLSSFGYLYIWLALFIIQGHKSVISSSNSVKLC